MLNCDIQSFVVMMRLQVHREGEPSAVSPKRSSFSMFVGPGLTAADNAGMVDFISMVTVHMVIAS
jgi:hypothetical protein